jgi:hypothetical protein
MGSTLKRSEALSKPGISFQTVLLADAIVPSPILPLARIDDHPKNSFSEMSSCRVISAINSVLGSGKVTHSTVFTKGLLANVAIPTETSIQKTTELSRKQVLGMFP